MHIKLELAYVVLHHITMYMDLQMCYTKGTDNMIYQCSHVYSFCIQHPSIVSECTC